MQLSFELLSFILSIVSLIVSGGAVWLSFKFYQMSDNASKEAKRSSDQIKSSTEKLEGLFSRLYTDTFTMMKDTVTDMRQHIYHNSGNGESLEDKLNEMKESINREVKMTFEETIDEINENDSKINTIEKKLEEIINQQINVVIEERYNQIADEILRILNESQYYMVFEIDSLLSQKVKVDMSEIITTLEKMRELNLINTDDKEINPFTQIKRIK
ncbi:hypothetical protein [Proteus hauseri]|uniref:hypothetical protein n=1 Tax=Proteus hauseri TaxID=183417 RepID=UPI0032DB51D6